MAVPDENRPSWRPHDPSGSEFRGRDDDDRDDRGWRGDRGYRDDRERSIEYRGQGQSGYGAGRYAEDRAYHRQVRNEPPVSAGSFEDRNHDLGVDDRFTGRGGRDSYGQDRGGRDHERQAGRGGRDFSAERREPSRRWPSRDERYGADERHAGGYGREGWSGGGYGRDERSQDSGGYGHDEGSGGYARDERTRHGAGYGRDDGSGGYSRDERPRYGGGYGRDEWSGGYTHDERPRYGGGYGRDEWSGGGYSRDERTGYAGGYAREDRSGYAGGYGRDERFGGFGRGYGGYPGGSMGTQDVAERSGGIDSHVHRGVGPHRGKGPVGYERSDERIREMVCESLADDDEIDASQIEVAVSGGEVTLSGTVENRRAKREAEECVFSVSGVREVQNQLRVRDSRSWTRTGASTSPAGTTGATGTSATTGKLENGKTEISKSELDVSAQDKKHRA